jgi:hypothetical protein
MAPELRNGSIHINNIDFKLADLWSFGVLMYSTVYWREPFKIETVWEGN